MLTQGTPDIETAGADGDWEILDSASPVMTEGARKWIRDLAGQFAAAGISASFAFSMEVYNPPAAMRAKYLSLSGGVVSPGQDVFLDVPSHQMHFGTRVRNYLRQMYKECADEIAAAGLPVVLQFGETQWWYFDNRALDALGGMPFYDRETIDAFAAAKGRQIWPFLSNTDDPAGDPAHPNETADFLRDRIWSYCQEVISYVRASHPAALFECLWPLDANRGKPAASTYRKLLMHVNLPNQWRNSSYGIKYFRCEGFDYDIWQKDTMLMRETLSFGTQVLGRPASECMYLAGLYGPPDPPIAQAYGMWLQAPFYSMCFWAFDQFCLNSRPIPLEMWRQSTASASAYHKPRAARAVEVASAVNVAAPAGGALNRFKLNERKADYPGAIDSVASLFSPVDAFSGRPLETTTTAAVNAGDSTISVSSTSGGFAASYGILSIDDELVVYAAKTATQFTGCQRGAFGTVAAAHNNAVAVKANMVAGFITALQSAVLAIENELGTAATRNYVRKDGVVTITGLKTFQDGAEFGAGTKAGTGLARLPNNGAVKWRNADNSGDLGMALNASNHLAMDAIIDFAVGQTFGAFSYPGATTTSKGIVQVDPVGGIAVNAGVLSLSASGVTPGTYAKTTVDAKGRVTSGAALAAGDLPAHTHAASDIASGSAPFAIQNDGTGVGTRRALNLIQGSNVTLTFLDEPANDRVNVTVAATAGGSSNHNLLSATHPDTVAASPVLGDLIAANGTPAWARLAGNTTTTRKFLRQTGTGTVSALPVWDSLLPADLPTHWHAAGDVTSGILALARGGSGSDHSATGPGFLKQAAAGAAVTVAALVAGDLPAHTHTSAQISDATASATASNVVARDSSGGASFAYAAANNLWAYQDSHLQSVECGPWGTAGGPFENMAKYSEDFSVATWDKNGGTCTVTANAIVAPDGNQTADAVTANGAAGLIRQNIAGLVSGGQYTFYVWLKAPSGTMTVSFGALDNGWTAWLVGPTAVTLTTTWQRFKVTGTMSAGATALWVAIGHYSDGWTSGLSFHAWGACLQQGNDPKKAYARTWGYQTAQVAAGVACGPTVVAGINTTDSPFKVRGPGSNLTDHTLLEVTAGGELIIAGSTGNGYRFAELMGASNPSGWSGVLKVKNPAGVTAGYILLYSNP